MEQTATLKSPRKPNSKLFFMQRFAGGIIDVCIIFMACWGLLTAFMRSGLAYYYNRNDVEMAEIRDGYLLETGCGNKIIITEENKKEYSTYIIHTDSDNVQYVVTVNKDANEIQKEKYTTYIKEDKRYQMLRFNNRFINYGINLLGGFIVTMTFMMIVPLCNKRRVTIGGLFSEQALYSLRFERYAKWYHVVFRYFFIFIFEFAIPYIFFEMFTFFLAPITFLLIGSINSNGRCFHDFISRTKLIDNKTYTPMVEEEID